MFEPQIQTMTFVAWTYSNPNILETSCENMKSISSLGKIVHTAISVCFKGWTTPLIQDYYSTQSDYSALNDSLNIKHLCDIS